MARTRPESVRAADAVLADDGDVQISALDAVAADTQTTVGAAGAASALPANPLGYLKIKVAGVVRAVPYYNA